MLHQSSLLPSPAPKNKQKKKKEGGGGEDHVNFHFRQWKIILAIDNLT